MTATTTRNAATAAEETICFGNRPAGVLSCAAIQMSAIANKNCMAEAPHVKSVPRIAESPRGPTASRISDETKRARGTIRNASWSGRGDGLTGLRSCAIARISASGGLSERSIMHDPFEEYSAPLAGLPSPGWRAREPPWQ